MRSLVWPLPLIFVLDFPLWFAFPYFPVHSCRPQLRRANPSSSTFVVRLSQNRKRIIRKTRLSSGAFAGTGITIIRRRLMRRKAAQNHPNFPFSLLPFNTRRHTSMPSPQDPLIMGLGRETEKYNGYTHEPTSPIDSHIVASFSKTFRPCGKPKVNTPEEINT
jgi:hypothetical protein